MSMDVPVCNNGMVAESRIEIPIRDVTDVCVCVSGTTGWLESSLALVHVACQPRVQAALHAEA